MRFRTAATLFCALTLVLVVDRARAQDSDLDGVDDDLDNCTLVFNLAQRDTDFDGFGNLCDADFDDDDDVGAEDLTVLKSRFFGSDGDADMDGNGAVNYRDLVM